MKVKLLQIRFDKKLQSYDLRRFRAAIIEKTKRRISTFHNHYDDGRAIYRYPLVQYKIMNKKPLLVCFAEATDDIHHLLRHDDYQLTIGNKLVAFEIEEAKLQRYPICVSDKLYNYTMRHYIGLNQDNYSIYKGIDGYVQRIEFIEELLLKHLKIFARAMNVEGVEALKVSIVDYISDKYIEYKKVFHLTFTLDFKTNLTIPDYTGIGKGVSIGFGTVLSKNKTV